MYEKMWNRDFILLTLSNFFMCITYYALISTLPVYLVNELYAGKSQVGLVLGRLHCRFGYHPSILGLRAR